MQVRIVNAAKSLTMSRITRIFIVIGMAGLVAALSYSVTGSPAAAAGQASVPTYAIGVGYALMLIGVVGSSLSFAINLFGKRAHARV